MIRRESEARVRRQTNAPGPHVLRRRSRGGSRVLNSFRVDSSYLGQQPAYGKSESYTKLFSVDSSLEHLARHAHIPLLNLAHSSWKHVPKLSNTKDCSR